METHNELKLATTGDAFDDEGEFEVTLRQAKIPEASSCYMLMHR